MEKETAVLVMLGVAQPIRETGARTVERVDLQALPVAPTTQRKFGPGTQVAVFFRVYRGGLDAIDAVPLRIQVRDSSDTLVLDRRQMLDRASFAADRSANVNVDLPVGRMPAGEYLLTVEASTGKSTANRSIRFEVVK